MKHRGFFGGLRRSDTIQATPELTDLVRKLLLAFGDIKRDLNRIGQKIMADLQQVQSVLDTISGDVTNVKSQMGDLKNQIANMPRGGLSPDQQSQVDKMFETATNIHNALSNLDTATTQVSSQGSTPVVDSGTGGSPADSATPPSGQQ